MTCIRLVVFMLVLSDAHALETPGDFTYRAPITFSPGQAIYQVELPLAVHQGIRRADLGDLRVFNGAGEIVPHALREVAPLPAQEAPLEARIFPYRGSIGAREIEIRPDVRIELQPSGAVVIGVQKRPASAPSDPKPNAYYLEVGAKDKAFKALQLDWDPLGDGFSGRVDVHASDDLRSWRAVTNDAPLIDVQRGEHRLVLDRIEFSTVRARYLRLTWPPTQTMPELRSARVVPATQAESALRSTEHEAQPGEKAGEYVVDLGAPLVVQRLQIQLPQQNTVSAIAISVRARPSEPWRHVERATFYRLLHDGKEWRNPERTLAIGPARYWRLSVESRGGGLGTGLPKLIVTWEPRLLVFVARGEGPFTLAYGHSKYEPADFRVDALVPGLAEGKPVPVAAAALGTPSPGSGKHRRGMGDLLDLFTGETGRRWLLWSVLLGGVAILGAMAWRMAKNLSVEQRK